MPVFGGEIAASYHHREAEPEAVAIAPAEGFSDQRFGFDGKWDMGVGMWVEGALVHRDLDVRDSLYQRLATVGMDYTFDLGNGLNVLGEHFISETSEEAFGSGEDASFSAALAQPSKSSHFDSREWLGGPRVFSKGIAKDH